MIPNLLQDIKYISTILSGCKVGYFTFLHVTRLTKYCYKGISLLELVFYECKTI